jgi:hypothetical protein
MCLVQVMNGIFFQDVVQMYLLSLICYEPIFQLFLMGGAWVIGRFRDFIAFQREYSVLLSGMRSMRNLLIDDCFIVLNSIDDCWLTLFRKCLSFGFLDWCHFLLSLRFSAMRSLISFGKLRPFSFVLITGLLFHEASWIAFVKSFSSLSSWSAVLSGTDRLILLSSK